MSDNTKPLHSKPISKVEIDEIDPQYIGRVTRYLEHELHCKVTHLGDKRYFIQFPEGTVEEVDAGKSTQWTYRTTIRFPGEATTLTKYVTAPLNPTLHGKTLLAFPNSVLEGPETPQ